MSKLQSKGGTGECIIAGLSVSGSTSCRETVTSQIKKASEHTLGYVLPKWKKLSRLDLHQPSCFLFELGQTMLLHLGENVAASGLASAPRVVHSVPRRFVERKTLLENQCRAEIASFSASVDSTHERFESQSHKLQELTAPRTSGGSS